MKNFTLRSILGTIARMILLVPFVLLMFDIGEYNTINDNISVFLLIILGTGTVLFMGIMAFIPAEYAIRTNIDIIEFHMWTPQVVLLYISGVITIGVAMALAGFAFYTSAAFLTLYAVALYMWPKYMQKVDEASKAHMLSTLRAGNQ